ncbi:MAG: SpoIIE family protein phosphatase, partial [Bacteroidota bacterium]|nr:SpoIIE family protein phosphatase [Bacteroidota bacterium]
FGHKENSFVEVGVSQENKSGCPVCGDVFLSRKIKSENRYVAVLSDGMGTGIKANVLSTMTASMSMNFCLRNEPVIHSAISILNTLPVDSFRKRSYATFTLVDGDDNGDLTLVEFENPAYILFREGKEIEIAKEKITLQEPQAGRTLLISHIHLFRNDRLILFSNGITHSGMSQELYPSGWGREGVICLIKDVLKEQPDISAYLLSKLVVKHAVHNDNYTPKDDLSCAVIYIRQPRNLLICSGPPYNKDKDSYLADAIMNYPGKKIICGGTTSRIISRELHRTLIMDIGSPINQIPPAARMDGIDLVTEGILTLSSVADLLEKEVTPEKLPSTPDGDIVRLIFESDHIDFLIGTRINEANQDPNLPVEMEDRKNIIRRITKVLEENYLKNIQVSLL